MQSVSPVDGVVVDTTLSCSKVPASSLETAQLQHYLARNCSHKPERELGKPSACQCFIGRQSWVTSWCRMRWQPITNCTDQPAPDKERHRVIACVPMVVQGKNNLRPTLSPSTILSEQRYTPHELVVERAAPWCTFRTPVTLAKLSEKKNPYTPHLGAEGKSSVSDDRAEFIISSSGGQLWSKRAWSRAL